MHKRHTGGRRASHLITSADTLPGMNIVAVAIASLFGGPAYGALLPSGGQIVAGSGSIHQNGSAMTVTQGSTKMIANWQSFNIGRGNSVNFVQPSSSAVALNRVLGSDVSTIQGALKANGQVFLLNPNGVLFSPTAQVNVGGLIASTLKLSDQDFLNGHYRFQGDSDQAVVNQGRINAKESGYVALLGAKVVNQGNVDLVAGHVVMGSGSDMTIDLGGPTKLTIDKGVLDGLVDNGGAIRADGGTVIFNAKAADHLASSVINNTGLVRAQTLATGKQGEIRLIGDMDSGTLNLAGTLDASAPTAGNGGKIETSAAVLNTRQANVTAGASHGHGGSWLIDPYDYTIDAIAAGNIVNALNSGTNVTVTTQAQQADWGAGATGSGDITVNSAIVKTTGADAALTLQADRNVTVNSSIASTSGKLDLTLSAANDRNASVGGVQINADLNSNGGNILIGGAGGNVTSAQSHGIGYALNHTSLDNPAVLIGAGTTIQSGGGDIVINGQTAATAKSLDATKAGIYVLSGATVKTGGGDLYMSAVSSADARSLPSGSRPNQVRQRPSKRRGRRAISSSMLRTSSTPRTRPPCN